MAEGRLLVAKFGGTSLADGPRIRRVADTIRSDPARTCIVVSAPGKRFVHDEKITDLLEKWCKSSDPERAVIFGVISERFEKIVRDLDIRIDLNALFQRMLGEARCIEDYPERLLHFMRSRGEWLNAQIVAVACGFKFIDAEDVIAFTHRKFDLHKTGQWARHIELSEKAHRGIVLPGFYGRTTGAPGDVWTFSRGGSDITGAIVAALVGASVYENWTDVDGMLQTDPRIVPEAATIERMSYSELRELTFMGASVFHQDAARFVWQGGIPTRIRSTMTPEKNGTLIEVAPAKEPGEVTGIAAKNGFTVITVEKYGVDDEIGALHRLIGIFSGLNMTIFHAPGSVDTMSVVVDSMEFHQKKADVVERIRRICQPDNIRISDDLALICVVGVGMKHVPGTAARLTSAIARAGVSIELLNQGASEINITVGVSESNRAAAVQAIWHEFFGGK
ncbi:aspartate kinase [Candidatus Kaiserbacteria bacterium]|nr:aspartate kinase [Candidatus Kaiserbacteria bacterium]